MTAPSKRRRYPRPPIIERYRPLDASEVTLEGWDESVLTPWTPPGIWSSEDAIEWLLSELVTPEITRRPWPAAVVAQYRAYVIQCLVDVGAVLKMTAEERKIFDPRRRVMDAVLAAKGSDNTRSVLVNILRKPQPTVDVEETLLPRAFAVMRAAVTAGSLMDLNTYVRSTMAIYDFAYEIGWHNRCASPAALRADSSVYASPARVGQHRETAVVLAQWVGENTSPRAAAKLLACGFPEIPALKDVSAVFKTQELLTGRNAEHIVTRILEELAPDGHTHADMIVDSAMAAVQPAETTDVV